MINTIENDIMKNWKTYDKPLVSMCWITYNHEKFISLALDSMLKQETDFPFEIIIRDDCSTDSTRIIIGKYTEKFPNIIRTIFEEENQYSKGINPFIPAYERAKGKYITILEGDDYWRDKFKLQKQVDFLEKNHEYILSYHNSNIIDNNNNIISKMKILIPHNYTQEQMLCGEALILTNTVMFRKVDSVSAEQLNGILNADTVLWHLLGRYGKSKYQGEIEYAAYRHHDGGVWSSLDKIEKFKNAIKTMHILKGMLPNNYSRLEKRIEKKINRGAFILLYKSISVLDFKASIKILKLIIYSEDLSILKIFLLVPSFLLKK